MTAGVTGLSVVMETRPTVSPTAQIPSARANQVSRRRDTTPVEVQNTAPDKGPGCLHVGDKELGCNIFQFICYVVFLFFLR